MNKNGWISIVQEHASFLTAIAVFGVVWLAFTINALAIDRYASQPKAYFPELAEAFLEGRTYLIDPPRTLDLTFFEERWYVAFPPLAALLMLPEVAMEGPTGVNTVAFSILYAALNAALVFLILETFSRRGWTKLGLAGNLWITGLFTFSTALWQSTLGGSVTYINQVLSTVFVALAIYTVAATGSPYLAGIGLALAMLARPNVFLTWPFLLSIWMQRELEMSKETNFPKQARWLMASAVPVAIAILGLLVYNTIRFHHPFDFGYSHGDMQVLNLMSDELEQYGQFNPIFIPRNLHAMLLSLPLFDPQCAGGRLVPDAWGMSLLLTGPALLYAIRAREKQIWVFGGWVAVLANAAVVLMYYNTGYSQFGYRYSMDFMMPLICLTALGSGKRVSPLMAALILFGMVVNFIGMLWYYDGWC